HVARLTDQLEPAGRHRGRELCPDPAAEHPVIVDEDDPDAGPAHALFPPSGFLAPSGTAGSSSRISVPSPATLFTRAEPPCRSIRPTIASLMPSRSDGTDSGSKPLPRSRTKASTPSGPHSRSTRTGPPPACRAALVTASRTAASNAAVCASIGRSP